MITACGTTPSEDVVDFEVELQALGTEATFLRDTMVVARTEIAATVAVAQEQAAISGRYNDMLRETTVAVIPPTPDERIVANDVEGPLPREVYDLSDGTMRIVQLGPAGQINSEDCFLAKQQFFRPSQGVVYMTAVALNVRAGTTFRADWQYGGQLVFSNSWVAPQSQDYRCVSLAMRTSDTEFFLGNWSVTLSVNGEPTEPRSFSIFSD